MTDAEFIELFKRNITIGISHRDRQFRSDGKVVTITLETIPAKYEEAEVIASVDIYTDDLVMEDT